MGEKAKIINKMISINRREREKQEKWVSDKVQQVIFSLIQLCWYGLIKIY